MDPIRVAVIEDEIMVARMLEAWIGNHHQFKLVASAHDGTEGLALCLKTKPDVALIDIMMPGMNGITLAEHLLSKLPTLKIIILSARLDPYCIHRIHDLKIPGYVDKSCSPEIVTEAILAVARGETFHTPNYTERMLLLLKDPNAFFKILSKREIDIMRHLTANKRIEDIATAMDITRNTVQTHQRNIRKKLNAHNTQDLLSHARKHGLF